MNVCGSVLVVTLNVNFPLLSVIILDDVLSFNQVSVSSSKGYNLTKFAVVTSESVIVHKYGSLVPVILILELVLVIVFDMIDGGALGI